MGFSRLAAGGSLAALGLMLAACGGGGGVNSTPTPTPTGGTPTPTPGGGTPTPTPTTGNDLTGPLESRSFTNDAAEMSAVSVGSAGIAATAAVKQMTITYDAATQAYTLTVGARSRSFGPGDLSQAKSTSKLAVYEISSGGVTDTLTLTKPGTSGQFTYRFVGGAFWQRSDPSQATALIDVATYGFETADNALPRTGTASYAVDLMGYETHEYGTAIDAITGSGSLDVDFAKGVVITSGTLTRADYDDVEFDGKATLSTTDNGFSGTFSFFDYSHFTGTLEGRFYGPNAQEVGAVFSTQDTKLNSAVGVLIGRKDGAGGTNSDFVNPAYSQFFTSNTQSLSTTYDSAAGTYSSIAHSSAPVLINFQPASGKYVMTSGDRVAVHTVEPYQQRFYPVDRIEVYQTDYRTSFETLKYVTGMSWASRILLDGSKEKLDFRNFVYGFPTAANSVPVSGKAAYDLSMAGTIVDRKYQAADFSSEPAALIASSGDGTLFADFASGKLTLEGELALYLEATNLHSPALIEGSGSISSSSNGFTGTLTATSPDNSYSGNFDGQFFGPGAAEVGGTFLASNGPNALLAGYFVGAKDQALIDASTPLAAYSSPVTFATNTAQYPADVDGGVELDFDPAANRFVFHDSYNHSPLLFTIKQSDIVAGTQAAARIEYSTNEGDRQLSGWVHNSAPGNSEINLTYTSFAAFETRYDFGLGTQEKQYMLTFGNVTPEALMPRSGTARYSGIAIGQAEMASTGYIGGVHGTSGLTADFGNGTFASEITLFTDQATPQSLGTYLYDGGIGTNGLYGTATGHHDYTGQLSGDFYGPNADEYGFAWTLYYYTSAVGGALGNSFYGIAVGKKD
ncbi:hypothetical protein SZ64_07320 [Erythrobacter sp. SG61-1L]|uniref:transferrin-binding protein-like solute binding protein n=1 Tax=Erythrobacter sp. SG61-1L TaxID=1603897 RepID=UPI0006C90201|nr:transferrin-binding protein-like solute binding protein [Erythrobacter sp. SG61-1L]KPL67944.1 hypothetical protein SZ64_07320 [Erythrobacter sp. SG61-1L]